MKLVAVVNKTYGLLSPVLSFRQQPEMAAPDAVLSSLLTTTGLRPGVRKQ